MKKRTFIMTLLVCIVLVGFASPAPAQEQAGISTVTPLEGTVGTVITILGSGFGQKTGDVMLDAEKCKVLSWSEAEITCQVDKPQPPGKYSVAVLLQGDKKPAEPMIYSFFSMRRPMLSLGELVRDGDTITVAGAFFGDKKGVVAMAYRDGGIVVDNTKVLDWSMESIRIELPGGLTGRFILVVRNEVGAGLALFDLENGPPLLGVFSDPDGSGYDYDLSAENSSGVWFKGKFYVFSVNEYVGLFYPKQNYRIQVQVFDQRRALFSDYLPTFPENKSKTAVAPLVIGDKLWVFATATDRYINYTWCTFDPNTNTCVWETSWHEIGWRTDDDTFQIMPVYNPVTGRITIYYLKDKKLWWGYSIDYGKTWPATAAVTPGVTIDDGPGAVHYSGTVDGKPYNTLVATSNELSGGWGTPKSDVNVFGVNDQTGSIVGSVLYFQEKSYIYGGPFLMDDMGDDFIALLYFIDDPADDITGRIIPMVRKLKKNTTIPTWDPPYELMTLPTLDRFQGWVPKSAITYVPDGSGGYNRRFLLFFGWKYGLEDTNDEGPFRWINNVENLGPGVPPP